MKKLLILGVMALVSSSAYAAQTTVQPLDLFRYDFKCEFSRHDDNNQQDDRKFEAAARVFANDDYRSVKLEDLSLTNLLAVSFDDSLISANAAILNSTERFVQIQDANGTPSVFVVRPHDHDMSDSKWMKYDAFLALGDHKIPGTCKLRRSPVRGQQEVLQ